MKKITAIFLTALLLMQAGAAFAATGRDLQVFTGRQLRFQLFQLSKALVVGLYGGHVGVDLGLDLCLLFLGGLLQLAEERAVGLGKRVALRTQIARLRDGGAVELVQLDHFVHERQLFILILLFDVLFYNGECFINASLQGISGVFIYFSDETLL